MTSFITPGRQAGRTPLGGTLSLILGLGLALATVILVPLRRNCAAVAVGLVALICLVLANASTAALHSELAQLVLQSNGSSDELIAGVGRLQTGTAQAVVRAMVDDSECGRDSEGARARYLCRIRMQTRDARTTHRVLETSELRAERHPAVVAAAKPVLGSARWACIGAMGAALPATIAFGRRRRERSKGTAPFVLAGAGVALVWVAAFVVDLFRVQWGPIRHFPLGVAEPVVHYASPAIMPSSLLLLAVALATFLGGVIGIRWRGL